MQPYCWYVRCRVHEYWYNSGTWCANEAKQSFTSIVSRFIVVERDVMFKTKPACWCGSQFGVGWAQTAVAITYQLPLYVDGPRCFTVTSSEFWEARKNSGHIGYNKLHSVQTYVVCNKVGRVRVRVGGKRLAGPVTSDWGRVCAHLTFPLSPVTIAAAKIYTKQKAHTFYPIE